MTQTAQTYGRTTTTNTPRIRAICITAGFIALVATMAASAQSPGRVSSAHTETLFDSVNDSVCTISAIATDGSYVSRGSGFILKANGLLVTNAHVLSGLQQATAKCGGRQFEIERIVRFDRDVDLAVADIGDVGVPGLALAQHVTVKPGSAVYVFGSPYGLEGTMTPGLASGKRVIDDRTYIQISAPIDAGSSGGPVTDETGAVIGVAVASLEVAQSINFAIPAAQISALPDVELRPAELAGERSGIVTTPVVKGPSLPIKSAVATGTSAFRGNVFGSPCGDVAVAEYERSGTGWGGGGAIRFEKHYSGTLELDVDLLGTPATVYFDCDSRFGMLAGRYRIQGHTEGVDAIASVLRSKYGTGVTSAVSEDEAGIRGCRFNRSLPASRFYRPSELMSWRVNDRFHIDLLVCGGRSRTTLLFYSDPALIANAMTGAGQGAAAERSTYQEGDL